MTPNERSAATVRAQLKVLDDLFRELRSKQIDLDALCVSEYAKLGVDYHEAISTGDYQALALHDFSDTDSDRMQRLLLDGIRLAAEIKDNHNQARPLELLLRAYERGEDIVMARLAAE